MSVFVSKRRERVVDPENAEQWIEIKAKLSRGDESQYKDWLIKMSPVAGETIDFQTVDWETPLLRLAIVDWHLTDPDKEGEWVKFNAALISEFDPASPLVDAVLGRIAELNPTFGFRTQPSETNGTNP